MTASAVLDEVRRRGISLWTEGAHLHYRAPHGAINQELYTLLRMRKTELLALLKMQSEPAPAVGDPAGLSPERGPSVSDLSELAATFQVLAKWRDNSREGRFRTASPMAPESLVK